MLLQFECFTTSHATSVRHRAIVNGRERGRDADANKCVTNARTHQIVDNVIIDVENGQPVGLDDDVSTAAVTHNQVTLLLLLHFILLFYEQCYQMGRLFVKYLVIYINSIININLHKKQQKKLTRMVSTFPLKINPKNCKIVARHCKNFFLYFF